MNWYNRIFYFDQEGFESIWIKMKKNGKRVFYEQNSLQGSIFLYKWKTFQKRKYLASILLPIFQPDNYWNFFVQDQNQRGSQFTPKNVKNLNEKVIKPLILSEESLLYFKSVSCVVICKSKSLIFIFQ